MKLPLYPTGEGITDESQVLRLAHIRQPSAGAPGWPGTARTIIPGVDPSVSQYDTHNPYSDVEDQMERRYSGGVLTEKRLLPPDEGTSTRNGRTAAHFDSTRAAPFFQGFANVRWSGVMAGLGLTTRALVRPRPLSQNFNLAAFGTKELHPATQYEPVPPMGALVDFYGSSHKAL